MLWILRLLFDYEKSPILTNIKTPLNLNTRGFKDFPFNDLQPYVLLNLPLQCRHPPLPHLQFLFSPLFGYPSKSVNN